MIVQRNMLNHANPHPVRRTYSKDVRDLVIHQRFTLEKTTTAIAIDLNMSLRVVQRTIKLWEDIGDVIKTPKNITRAPLMTASQEEVSFMYIQFSFVPLTIVYVDSSRFA